MVQQKRATRVLPVLVFATVCAVAAAIAVYFNLKKPVITPGKLNTEQLRSLSVSHPTPEVLLVLFQRTYDAGDKDGALKIARQIVHLAPRDARGHNALGIAYSANGDPDAAKKAFQNAIALNSHFVDPYVNLGRLSLLLGDNQRALNEFDLATSVNPKSASAFTGLGEANAKLYNAPEATEAFQRAIEIAPNRPQAYAHLGAFLAELGNGDKARPHLKRAQELGDKSAALYEGLAMAYADQPQSQDELKQALEYAQKAQAMGNRSALVFYAKGLALQRLGRYDEAVENFKRVISLSDNANGAWIGIAQCYRAQGKIKEAAVAAKTGERILSERQHILNLKHEIRFSPNRLDKRLEYSDALMTNGQYLLAADQYRYVALHSPDKPSLWLKAAHAFDLGGEKQLADYLRPFAKEKPRKPSDAQPIGSNDSGKPK